MDSNLNQNERENETVVSQESVEAPVAVDEYQAPPIKSQGRDYAAMFSHPLFLAICILVTVSFGVLLFSGHFDLFKMLFMIALWVTFGAANKKQAPISGIKFSSGLVMAEYIISYVICACVIISGIAMLSIHFAFGYTFEDVVNQIVNIPTSYSGYSFEIIDEFKYFVSNFYYNFVNGISRIGINDAIAHSVLFITAAVSVVTCGIIALVINVIFTRRIHHFASSLYKNAQDESVPVESAKITRVWLMIIGVFTAFGIFNGNFITVGTTAAATICGSVWVGKYFK